MNMGSYSYSSLSKIESKKISSLSALLKIIAEESRLKLLRIIKQEEHCVCEIMNHTDLSQSLISHHLKDLKDIGIVKDEKRGLKVYYSLTEKGKNITDLIFNTLKKEVATV